MVRRNIAVLFTIGLALTACGGSDSSSKAPTRDELVKQIVESGGVSEEVAGCAADALFTSLSAGDLSLVMAGKEPSADGKTAFTNAVLDCLTPPTEPATTEPATTAAPVELSQWATSAEASSQYGDTSWSAAQATGEPEVVECGDNGKAWASLTTTEVAVLTATFDTAVVPSAITIFESYNPGTVTMVEVIDADGMATTVYTGSAVASTECPLSETIAVTGVTKAVKQVRITVDETVLQLGWTEIDAVQLVGTEA